MTSTAEEVAAVLVSHSPRLQATRLLGLLVTRSEAVGAVLLSVVGGRVVIFATAGELSPDRVAQACSGWEWHRAALEGAQTVQSGTLALIPVKDQKELVGFVYLDHAKHEVPGGFAEFAAPLAQAILATPGALPPAAPSGPEKPRQTLLRALEENEWNVARVARILRVTRRTIYLRMAKYEIDRKKVPKTLKMA